MKFQIFIQCFFHCYKNVKLDCSIIKVANIKFQEVNNVIEEASQQAIQNLPRYVKYYICNNWHIVHLKFQILHKTYCFKIKEYIFLLFFRKEITFVPLCLHKKRTSVNEKNLLLKYHILFFKSLLRLESSQK